LKRRLGIALATLALALQAFWPLIAQARLRNVNLVPLCTVEGVTHYVEVPGGQTPAEERTARHGDHCAFCLFGSDKLVTPSLAILVVPNAAASAPSSSNVALVKPVKAKAARPRAPPLFSFVPQSTDESRRTNEEASMLGGAHGAAGERGRLVRRRVLHA
jgi:hypothetical protein